MYRHFFAAALAVLLLLVSTLTYAGSFRSTPLRLHIDSKSKTGVVRITNEGKEKLTVQIDAKSWSQDDSGHDSYADTTDIVLFPKIATIAKGETRIVRVAYSGSEAGQERTYRIFIQELPVQKPGEVALRFALTLSLPLFVAPTTAKGDWSTEFAGLKEESLQIKVKNNTNHHIMTNKIKAIGLDTNGTTIFTQETTGWYVLAGNYRTFSVKIPYQECRKANHIKVDVQTRKSSKLLDFAVSKAMCSHKLASKPRTNHYTPAIHP